MASAEEFLYCYNLAWMAVAEDDGRKYQLFDPYTEPEIPSDYYHLNLKSK